MGFKKIFIGSIFTFLDFRFNGFDILPDFIGYILILIGLSEIINLNHKFEIARIITIILLVLSLPDTVIWKNFSFLPNAFNYSSVPLLTVITLILSLIYAYNLFIGIKENAEEIGNIELVNKAQLSWTLTVILIVGSLIGLIAPIILIPLIILIIITLIVQLQTLSMAEILEKQTG